MRCGLIITMVQRFEFEHTHKKLLLMNTVSSNLASLSSQKFSKGMGISDCIIDTVKHDILDKNNRFWPASFKMGIHGSYNGLQLECPSTREEINIDNGQRVSALVQSKLG